jgi:hypothetical protein
MCHGVFDVVHPGDLRHLLYARPRPIFSSPGLAADVDITKSRYRPHVPENLPAVKFGGLQHRQSDG